MKFLVLLFPISLQAQDCFICLTRAQAELAADSAMQGQSYERKANYYYAVSSIRKVQVDTLMYAAREDSLSLVNMTLAKDFESTRSAGWEHQYNVEHQKRTGLLATLKRIGEFLAAAAIGYSAGHVASR